MLPLTGGSRRLGWPRGLRPPRGLSVSIEDLDPSFADDGRTATSRATVTLREPGPEGGADSMDVREVETTWIKGDAWQLSLVTILEGDEVTR